MSVAGSIADAIVTAVTGLGLVYGTPPVTLVVVKRKKPSLPQGTDPPQVVVSVGDITAVKPMSARKDFVTRNAAVAVVAGGGKVTGDDDDFREILEQIRVAVNDKSTFAAVPQFNRIDPSKESPFDAGALKVDANFGFVGFSVQTLEARNM